MQEPMIEGGAAAIETGTVVSRRSAARGPTGSILAPGRFALHGFSQPLVGCRGRIEPGLKGGEGFWIQAQQRAIEERFLGGPATGLQDELGAVLTGGPRRLIDQLPRPCEIRRFRLSRLIVASSIGFVMSVSGAA